MEKRNSDILIRSVYKLLRTLVLFIACVIVILMIIVMLEIVFKSSSGKSSSDILYTITTVFTNLSSPFVAIVAALLTYFAFMEQVKANAQQVEQFTQQFNSQNKVVLENQLLDLLKMHRENVININQSISFIQILKEFKYGYIYFWKSYFEDDWDKYREFFNNSKWIEDRLDQVYKNCDCVSQVIRILMNGGVDESVLPENYITHFLSIDKDYIQRHKVITYEFNQIIQRETFSSIKYRTLPTQAFVDISLISSEKYIPYQGREKELSLYFYHLKFLISFVINLDEKLFTQTEKEFYFELIRSQLSKDELYLVYFFQMSSNYNIISEDLILKSKLLYNLPVELYDLGVNPIFYFHSTHNEMFSRNR